jgi:hypothetical protein
MESQATLCTHKFRSARNVPAVDVLVEGSGTFQHGILTQRWKQEVVC